MIPSPRLSADGSLLYTVSMRAAPMPSSVVSALHTADGEPRWQSAWDEGFAFDGFSQPAAAPGGDAVYVANGGGYIAKLCNRLSPVLPVLRP